MPSTPSRRLIMDCIELPTRSSLVPSTCTTSADALGHSNIDRDVVTVKQENVISETSDDIIPSIKSNNLKSVAIAPKGKDKRRKKQSCTRSSSLSSSSHPSRKSRLSSCAPYSISPARRRLSISALHQYRSNTPSPSPYFDDTAMEIDEVPPVSTAQAASGSLTTAGPSGMDHSLIQNTSTGDSRNITPNASSSGISNLISAAQLVDDEQGVVGLSASGISSPLGLGIPNNIKCGAATPSSVKQEHPHSDPVDLDEVDMTLNPDKDAETGASSDHIRPPSAPREEDEEAVCGCCYEDITTITKNAEAAGKGGLGGSLAIFGCEQANCGALFCIPCLLQYANGKIGLRHDPTCPACTRPIDTECLSVQAKAYDPTVAVPLRPPPPQIYADHLPWVQRYIQSATFQPVHHTDINDFVLYFFQYGLPRTRSGERDNEEQLWHMSCCFFAWCAHFRLDAAQIREVERIQGQPRGRIQIALEHPETAARVAAVRPANSTMPVFPTLAQLKNAGAVFFGDRGDERILHRLPNTQRASSQAAQRCVAQLIAAFDIVRVREPLPVLQRVKEAIRSGQKTAARLLMHGYVAEANLPADATIVLRSPLAEFLVDCAFHPYLARARGQTDIRPLLSYFGFRLDEEPFVNGGKTLLPLEGPIGTLAKKVGLVRQDIRRIPTANRNSVYAPNHQVEIQMPDMAEEAARALHNNVRVPNDLARRTNDIIRQLVNRPDVMTLFVDGNARWIVPREAQRPRQQAGNAMQAPAVLQDDARLVVGGLGNPANVLTPIPAPQPHVRPVADLAALDQTARELFDAEQALIQGNPQYLQAFYQERYREVIRARVAQLVAQQEAAVELEKRRAENDAGMRQQADNLEEQLARGRADFAPQRYVRAVAIDPPQIAVPQNLPGVAGNNHLMPPFRRDLNRGARALVEARIRLQADQAVAIRDVGAENVPPEVMDNQHLMGVINYDEHGVMGNWEPLPEPPAGGRGRGVRFVNQ